MAPSVYLGPFCVHIANRLLSPVRVQPQAMQPCPALRLNLAASMTVPMIGARQRGW